MPTTATRTGYCTACGAKSAALSPRGRRCPGCEWAHGEDARRRYRERALARIRAKRGTRPGPKPVLAEHERCRHCRLRKGSPKIRGLCRPCYGIYGVRIQYPTPQRAEPESAGPTLAELDALVASRYASLPDRQVPEPAWAWHETPTREGYDTVGCAGWEEWDGLDNRTGFALHPSTEPESIARDQREEVERAVDFLAGLGAVTAEAVGELVCLPVSVVVRRMSELSRE